MEELMKNVRGSKMVCAMGCGIALSMTTLGSAHAAPPLPEGGATVIVHIDSSVFAELRRRPRGSGAPFAFACDAPCDQPMPLQDDYEIIASSAVIPVRLAGAPGETVVIDVSPPSDGKKIGGAIMVGFGSVMFVIGAVIDVFGGLQRSWDPSGSDVMLAGGATVTGIALGLGIGGAVLFAKASSTDVSTKTERGAPAAPATEGDLLVRTPTWRMLDAFDRAAKAPATVPLFSRAF
jgi:hypothetical protein